MLSTSTHSSVNFLRLSREGIVAVLDTSNLFILSTYLELKHISYQAAVKSLYVHELHVLQCMTGKDSQMAEIEDFKSSNAAKELTNDKEMVNNDQ